MSNTEPIAYPFPAGPVNLKQNPPTMLQRLWIVQEMKSTRETSYSLAALLGCTSGFIRKLIFRVNKGIVPRGVPGRPRVLDTTSVSIIESARATGTVRTYDSVVDLLDTEYLESFKRAYPTKFQKRIRGKKRLRMPRRSRRRYMQELFPHLSNRDSNPHTSDNWLAEF